MSQKCDCGAGGCLVFIIMAVGIIWLMTLQEQVNENERKLLEVHSAYFKLEKLSVESSE